MSVNLKQRIQNSSSDIKHPIPYWILNNFPAWRNFIVLFCFVWISLGLKPVVLYLGTAYKEMNTSWPLSHTGPHLPKWRESFRLGTGWGVFIEAQSPHCSHCSLGHLQSNLVSLVVTPTWLPCPFVCLSWALPLALQPDCRLTWHGLTYTKCCLV